MWRSWPRCCFPSWHRMEEKDGRLTIQALFFIKQDILPALTFFLSLHRNPVTRQCLLALVSEEDEVVFSQLHIRIFSPSTEAGWLKPHLLKSSRGPMGVDGWSSSLETLGGQSGAGFQHDLSAGAVVIDGGMAVPYHFLGSSVNFTRSFQISM